MARIFLNVRVTFSLGGNGKSTLSNKGKIKILKRQLLCEECFYSATNYRVKYAQMQPVFISLLSVSHPAADSGKHKSKVRLGLFLST